MKNLKKILFLILAFKVFNSFSLNERVGDFLNLKNFAIAAGLGGTAYFYFKSKDLKNKLKDKNEENFLLEDKIKMIKKNFKFFNLGKIELLENYMKYSNKSNINKAKELNLFILKLAEFNYQKNEILKDLTEEFEKMKENGLICISMHGDDGLDFLKNDKNEIDFWKFYSHIRRDSISLNEDLTKKNKDLLKKLCEDSNNLEENKIKLEEKISQLEDKNVELTNKNLQLKDENEELKIKITDYLHNNRFENFFLKTLEKITAEKGEKNFGSIVDMVGAGFNSYFETNRPLSFKIFLKNLCIRRNKKN